MKHLIPPRALVGALVGLLVLTALSWALTHVSLGALALPVALGIAACKSLVVFGVFMEVARRGLTVRLALLTTAAFIALLCLGVASDIALR